MSKVIVITSGKGGVGKTTTAVNLGAAINYFGGDSIIVDANLSTPNVGIHLGSPIVPVNLNHVLAGKADIEEAIYEHESGTKIVPSSLSVKDLKKIKHERLKDLPKQLKEYSEYIIVDSAAGLGEEAISAIKMADELIVVTNPEMPAVTDALKAIKLAEEMNKPVRGIIVTRVRKNKTEMRPEAVKEMLETPILGMIPEDDKMQESLYMKNAIVYTHPYSKAARAYKEIAAKILDIKYDSAKDVPSLWARIFSR